jgi:hypothetical protein
LATIVRTIVDRIERSTVERQVALHHGVNLFELRLGDPAQSDAALICHQNHGQAGAVHPSDRLFGARQPLNLPPVAHVDTLRHLAIENAIAIDEDVSYCARVQRTHNYGLCTVSREMLDSIPEMRGEASPLEKVLTANDIIWSALHSFELCLTH